MSVGSPCSILSDSLLLERPTCNAYPQEISPECNSSLLAASFTSPITSILKESSARIDSPPGISKKVVISDPDPEDKYASLLPGSLFDSHCHLDFLFKKLGLHSYHNYLNKYPKGDFKQTYMGGVITNFCDPLSWGPYNEPIPLMEELRVDPRIHFTFGCHPRFAAIFNDAHLAKLEKLLQDKRVVALGEIGLDFADIEGKPSAPHDVQMSVFYEQLLLAKRFNMPLVLHIRNAQDEAIEILKKAGISKDFKIHRHCMIDNWEAAKRWLKEFPSSVIGLTNIVTRPDVPDVHELALCVPLKNIVLETDAPYFYPHHLLSQRIRHRVSYPMLVIHVAEKIVELRKSGSLKELILATKRNVERIYRLNESKDKSKEVGCQTMFKEDYVFSYSVSSDGDISSE